MRVYFVADFVVSSEVFSECTHHFTVHLGTQTYIAQTRINFHVDCPTLVRIEGSRWSLRKVEPAEYTRPVFDAINIHTGYCDNPHNRVWLLSGSSVVQEGSVCVELKFRAAEVEPSPVVW